MNALILKISRLSLVGLSAAILSACGGGGGTSVTELPNTTRTIATGNYDGPPPANADVQQFKLNFWDNLADQNTCGACHGAGGQSPTFVRDDDINLAYAQANTVVNLNSPSESSIVSKVGSGHNCWLQSDSACADTMTRYIELWAGGATGNATKIVLQAPVDKEPGESRVFPESSALFSTTVYPLMTTYCADCHIEGIQNPVLASADVDVAYAAAQSRMDLSNPENSRLVNRLRSDFHNCWDNCDDNADEVQTAIEQLAANIDPIAVDDDLVISRALALTDGVVANTGGRFQDNVIALYEFKTGSGNIAYDTSGVAPAMNLNLSGDVEWIGGWGINIRDGKAQALTRDSEKLHDLITATGEYTIEAWVVPANVTQEDARIIAYGANSAERNFTLGQTLYNYDFLHRSSTTDGNGEEALSTDDDAERLQATLQHVVATFAPGEGRRIYVNGAYTGDMDPVAPGNLSDWEDTFTLVLGNDASNNRQWQGSLRLVAIHNRAITDDQILQNYEVGVGQKFFLLFGVSHLIEVPQAYIVFEASQFDSYSYLFNAPYFVSLSPDAEIGTIPVEGLRIGINGKEASVGQAWANLDTALTDADYSAEEGQPLSTLGTIIALENGPEQDEFFLTFERLGDLSNVYIPAEPPPAPAPADGDEVSDIGLRTFDEINATMSVLTGVPRTQSAVYNTFQTIRQQLPTVETFGGFLSAQQMGITQLAIQYCNVLVEDTTLRAAYFPGFDFSAPADTAFTGASGDIIMDALIGQMLGSNLDTQPLDADVRFELGNLFTGLIDCDGGCEPGRTETVVKASCAAVLGSATTLVQ